MTSASMEMSASAKSGKETPQNELDEAIGVLKDKAREFAKLGASERAALLRACIPRIVETAPRWAEAGLRAKGVALEGPASSEEWLAAILPTIRNARLLAKSLD